MKTFAQIIHSTKILFAIYDENGHMRYYERKNKCWEKWKFDAYGDILYYENSSGTINNTFIRRADDDRS